MQSVFEDFHGQQSHLYEVFDNGYLLWFKLQSGVLRILWRVVRWVEFRLFG